MNSIAQDLRQLARDIERLCAASAAMSIASPVITNAVDHLCAVARIHELNAAEKQ